MGGIVSVRFFRIVFLLFLIFSLSEIWGVPLVLAVPDLNSGLHVYTKWDSVVDYLKENSSFDVRMVVVKNHRIIQEGFKKKTIDYAFIDPLWYARMYRAGLCIGLAKGVVSDDGYQYSLLIVNRDSIVRGLSDLRGRSIALVNQMESSAGYFVPLFLLSEYGVRKYFKRIIYSDSYMSVLKGVAFGKLDSGFVSSNIFISAEGNKLKNEIRVILRSSPIPQWVFVARSDLNFQQRNDFKAILLNFAKDVEGKQLLNSLGFTGFTNVDTRDYVIISKYLDSMEF